MTKKEESYQILVDSSFTLMLKIYPLMVDAYIMPPIPGLAARAAGAGLSSGF